MKYLVTIDCDCNDGDYLGSTKTLTSKELEKLKGIIGKLDTSYSGWKWNTRYDIDDEDELCHTVYKDILTEEEIDWLNDMLPRGEYGIHTIESIKVYEYTREYSL